MDEGQTGDSRLVRSTIVLHMHYTPRFITKPVEYRNIRVHRLTAVSSQIGRCNISTDSEVSSNTIQPNVSDDLSGQKHSSAHQGRQKAVKDANQQKYLQNPPFPTLFRVLTETPPPITNDKFSGKHKITQDLLRSDEKNHIDKLCNGSESIALFQGGKPSVPCSHLVAGKSESLVYDSDLNASHTGADPLGSEFILNYLLSEDRLRHTDSGSRGQFIWESGPSICNANSATCDQWTTEQPISPYAFCKYLESSAHEKGSAGSIVFPSHAPQTRQLSARMKKRRKSVHDERVDIDAEELTSSSNSIFVEKQPVAENLCGSDLMEAQQKGNYPFTATSSLDELLDLIVCSAEVSSSDISDIQDAFLNFFEKGEFSEELDEYFTKVLESEGIEANTNNSGCISPQGGRRSRSLIGEGAPSLLEAKKSAKRRQRNNEASKRSRAAHKARFQALVHELTELKVEKRELLIWLREIQMAVKEARRVLLSLEPLATDGPPDLSPSFSNSTSQ